MDSVFIFNPLLKFPSLWYKKRFGTSNFNMPSRPGLSLGGDMHMQLEHLPSPLLATADFFLVRNLAGVCHAARRRRQRRRWLAAARFFPVHDMGRTVFGAGWPPCSALERDPAHDPLSRRLLLLGGRGGETVLVHDPAGPRRLLPVAEVEGERRLDAHDELPLAITAAVPRRRRELHEHGLLLPRGLPVPTARSPPAPAAGRRRLPQAEEVRRLPFAHTCNNRSIENATKLITPDSRTFYSSRYVLYSLFHLSMRPINFVTHRGDPRGRAWRRRGRRG